MEESSIPSSIDGSARRENTPRQAAFLKVSGSFMSKVLGFFRDVFIAKVFGATYIVDVTQLVEGVVLSTVSFITSPIAIPLVPELTHARIKGEGDYRSLLRSVFGLFALVGLTMFTLVAVFPQVFAALFSGGFTGTAEVYAEYTYRWMSALAIVIVVTATLKTALSVKKDFWLISFGDVVMNLVVIGGLMAGARSQQLPIVKTGAHVVTAAVLWTYFGIKERWFLTPQWRHWDHRVRTLLKQAGPLFIGSATDMLLTLIDRTMASYLPEGSIASLGFAQKILLLPLGVWAVQIAESSYPFIVSSFAAQDVRRGYELARGAVKRILFIIVPACVGLFLLAPEVVRIIYQRGAFTAANTTAVARVLQGYMGLLLFSSVQYIETRLFYARRNTMAPMIISVASLGTNVGLNYVFGFVLHLGAFGLAVASSIAAGLSMMLMYAVYRRMYGAVDYKLILGDAVRIGMAAAIMGAAILIMRGRLGTLPLIGLSMAVYGLSALALREDEAVGYLALGRRLLARAARRLGHRS